jgi:hypothetical protein
MPTHMQDNNWVYCCSVIKIWGSNVSSIVTALNVYQWKNLSVLQQSAEQDSA